MKGIFVSYRRKDRPYATSLLVDRLSERYGEDRIFHDLQDIDIGENFLDRINFALESCSILIAIVGPDWLKHSKKKLHRDNDPVRMEIGTALARDILVIPVLCNAKMPNPDDLPAELREFAFKNALSLRSTDLDTDIKKLTDRLDREDEQLANGDTMGVVASGSSADVQEAPQFTLYDEEKRTTLTFKGRRTTLNRLNLDHGNLAISAKAHACVEYENGVWSLADLSSNKATFIEITGQVVVADGDWLLFGSSLFRFKTVDATAPDSHDTVPMAELGHWNCGLQARFYLVPSSGDALSFEGRELSVNRENLHSSNPAISRKQHARFSLCADGWHVTNLSSNKASFIQLKTPGTLADGMFLVFGRKVFSFHSS